MQAIFAPASTALASSVNVPADKLGVAVPPVPNPVQEMPDKTYPEGIVSVITVEVLAKDKVLVAPATPVPAVVVVIASVPKPFVPEKLNVPVPPLETFVKVNLGKGTEK